VEALAIVKHEMENPFPFKLRVDLEVDAKIGDNWYDCK
jgi:DNA polymerase I